MPLKNKTTNRAQWPLLIGLTLLLSGCMGSPSKPERKARTRILVDGIHQREGLPDLTWEPDEFRYPNSASTRRILNELKRHDCSYTLKKKGELTKKLLADFDILLFNVPIAPSLANEYGVDREVPPLRPEEIKAIRHFIQKGGGLLVIGEHNNSYGNMEILNPLLSAWDIELVDAYAHEQRRGKYAINKSAYRTLVRHFKKHFITSGIQLISAAGGAPFTPQSKGGVAFLSKGGYIDMGNYVTKKPMKFSNHKIDVGEYQGADIPVVIARQLGKGRVVALGDHNMVGYHWMPMGDNFDFALNVFQWLAKREKEPPFRNKKKHQMVFGFEQDKEGWHIARKGMDDYYYFFFSLTQEERIFPVAFSGLGKEVDVLGILDPRTSYRTKELAHIDQQLVDGKRVFLLFDAQNPNRGTVQLLQRYAPSLVISGANGSTAVKDLQSGPNEDITRLEGAFLPLGSNDIELNGQTVAALHHDTDALENHGGVQVPKSYENGHPYLLDVQLKGGTPLAWATKPDGKKTALLQKIPYKNGEIILMVQGQVWSGATMPYGVVAPTKKSRPAYEFEMKFLEWLVASSPKK